MNETNASAYSHYWRRKQLISGDVPAFPVRRWWPTEGLSEIEQVFFNEIGQSPSILDVGAGDLRVKLKIVDAGFAGEYHTLDVGDEYSHNYTNMDEVGRKYHAILCLDVIEHLPLGDGLSLLSTLASTLEPGGKLIVQTPNARCIRNPLGTDMTHLHCYNIADLWAYLCCHDLEVKGYRVCFLPEKQNVLQRLKTMTGQYVASRILGCDFADNIVLIARRP